MAIYLFWYNAIVDNLNYKHFIVICVKLCTIRKHGWFSQRPLQIFEAKY